MLFLTFLVIAQLHFTQPTVVTTFTAPTPAVHVGELQGNQVSYPVYGFNLQG